MMMKKNRIRKSFDGNNHQLVSRINGVVLAAAVLLLTAALLCGAAAADAEYFDTSGFATGYVEQGKPILLPMDTESIAANSEPDLEMNKRFPDAGQRKSSGMQSNMIMAKSLQNSKAETYPPRYDVRENSAVTSVKDQGEYGTCWAFASIAAIESNTIMHGYETAASADFSEAQLAYFTYNRNDVTKGAVPPVFSRLAGDDMRITSSVPFYDLGGNSVKAGHTLMAGIGVAQESVLPYSQLTSQISPSKAYTNNEYTVVATYIIPVSERNEIKSLLMHHGCGVIYYYSDIGAYGPNSDGSYSFYNPEKIPSNHAVTLVGWDDAYPIENFGPANRPENPGAWLIKNSWGSKGQDGYFWISYEDKSLNSFTFFEVNPSGYFDTIYQYDGGTYPMGWYGAEVDGTYISHFSNHFVADADQWITAAAFELFSNTTNTTLPSDLYVEVTVWNSTDKFHSEPQLLPTTLGYYSVSLPTPVYVSAGETFGVNLYVNCSSPVYVGADVCEKDEDIEYVSRSLDEQSFEFDFERKSWYPIPAEVNLNWRIKAYGVNADQPDKSLSLTSGWNFISISEPLENDSAETVFKGLDCAAHSPLWYDSSAQEWKLVKKTDSISTLEGYYVYSDSADTISVGKPVPRAYYVQTAEPYEKTISPGWNAVSLGSSVPFSAEKYLSGVSSWTNVTYDGVTYEHGTAITPANDQLLPTDTPMWLYADSTGSIREVW